MTYLGLGPGERGVRPPENGLLWLRIEERPMRDFDLPECSVEKFRCEMTCRFGTSFVDLGAHLLLGRRVVHDDAHRVALDEKATTMTDIPWNVGGVACEVHRLNR